MHPPTESPSEAALLVREYQPGDEERILRSFNRIYAAIDPGFHPRSMDEWRWRYAENPAGWRIWLVFDEAGEVIAQQAGTPLAVHHDGRRVHWNQVGDTFIDPTRSRALRNPGLFYRVAKPYSDHYGGAAPQRDPVLYGMPTRRALRIGQRQLGYEVVRNQNKLSARPDTLAPAPAPGIDVEEAGGFPGDVDTLFARLAGEHGALAVRDAAYLDWRYVRNPGAAYTIALARRAAPGRELCGYAVYRHGGFDGREDGLVCDLLVSRADERAQAALLAWLVGRAREDGAAQLTAVLPETCPESLWLQQAGMRFEPTGYFTVGRCYAGPYDMRWLYHHWYYQLGDFDLC